MREVAFQVDGIPRSQGSKTCICRDGRGVMWESNPALGPWRTAIRKQAKTHKVTWVRATPLALELTFVLPLPQDRDPGWYPNVPDADKLTRSVMDALQQGGVLLDDAQVVLLSVRKLCGTRPGVTIRVTDAPYAYAHPATAVTLFEGA